MSEPISGPNFPSLCWMYFGLILVMLLHRIYANFLPGKHRVLHLLDPGQHQQPRMGKPLFQHLLRQGLCQKQFIVSIFVVLLLCMVSSGVQRRVTSLCSLSAIPQQKKGRQTHQKQETASSSGFFFSSCFHLQTASGVN